MLKVKFKYKESFSDINEKWIEMICVVNSIEEMIEKYKLGTDCDYEIISIIQLGT